MIGAALRLLGRVSATRAFGQRTDTWVGGGTGDWSIGTNWSNGIGSINRKGYTQ